MLDAVLQHLAGTALLLLVSGTMLELVELAAAAWRGRR
jgi:hypothetical protein